MTNTIQIMVCGTRGLNDDEFDKIKTTVEDALKDSDCTDIEFLRAHFDWSASPDYQPGENKKFRGLINVEYVGKATSDWRLKTDWRKTDGNLQSLVKAALAGTELEGATVQAASTSWASPSYEPAKSRAETMREIDKLLQGPPRFF